MQVLACVLNSIKPALFFLCSKADQEGEFRVFKVNESTFSGAYLVSKSTLIILQLFCSNYFYFPEIGSTFWFLYLANHFPEWPFREIFRVPFRKFFSSIVHIYAIDAILQFQAPLEGKF